MDTVSPDSTAHVPPSRHQAFFFLCPFEIRLMIYKMVMESFPKRVFEFQFESPKDLLVPASTLDALQNDVPAMARVCGEMRDYALKEYSISFNCSVYGLEGVSELWNTDNLSPPDMYSLDQRLLESKVVTGYFNPKRDSIVFKPSEWARVPDAIPKLASYRRKYGEVYHEYDVKAPDTPRVFALTASTSFGRTFEQATPPTTEFEKLVLRKWRKAWKERIRGELNRRILHSSVESVRVEDWHVGDVQHRSLHWHDTEQSNGTFTHFTVGKSSHEDWMRITRHQYLRRAEHGMEKRRIFTIQAQAQTGDSIKRPSTMPKYRYHSMVDIARLAQPHIDLAKQGWETIRDHAKKDNTPRRPRRPLRPVDEMNAYLEDLRHQIWLWEQEEHARKAVHKIPLAMWQEVDLSGGSQGSEGEDARAWQTLLSGEGVDVRGSPARISDRFEV